MDIIKFAMQMELDGQKFYEKAAEEAPNKELKGILLHLAEEEQRHFKFFASMREGAGQDAAKALEGGTIGKTKNLFVQLTENGQAEKFGEDVRTVWTKALKIEEKAVKMYSEEAEKESDTSRRSLLVRIADEERNHVYLIENVLTYLTDPETFRESKRYSDFKSWEGR